MVLCKLYLGRGQKFLTQTFKYSDRGTKTVCGGCSANKKIKGVITDVCVTKFEKIFPILFFQSDLILEQLYYLRSFRK